MPITGTTRECLTHFFGQDDQEARVKLIATFVEVTEGTASSWQRDQKLLPTGYRLLRLRVLLDTLGYKVAEFVKLRENYQQLAQQIVFGAYGFEDAVHMLEYAKNDGLYEVLLRGGDMEVGRRFKVDQLVAGYVNETLELIAAARKPFDDLKSISDEQPADRQNGQDRGSQDDQPSAAHQARPSTDVARVIGAAALAATVNPAPVPERDTEVTFDRTSLARSLNAAIRLNTQLFEAVRNSPDREAIRVYLGYDLDRADVRRLIDELERIFQASEG